MNLKTITVQAPFEPPKADDDKGVQFLHVLYGESGFVFRMIPLADSPLYMSSKTGEKRHLTMSLTSDTSEISLHGKVVLVFEEFLVSDEDKPVYKTWNPNEWFEYAE